MVFDLENKTNIKRADFAAIWASAQNSTQDMTLLQLPAFTESGLDYLDNISRFPANVQSVLLGSVWGRKIDPFQKIWYWATTTKSPEQRQSWIDSLRRTSLYS